MKEALTVVRDALDWLREHYSEFRFYVERDIVWTLQRRLVEAMALHLPRMRVFNDYPMLEGKKGHILADLALVDANNCARAVVEVKYEPSHSRPDILKQKLPVVGWGGVATVRLAQRVVR